MVKKYDGFSIVEALLTLTLMTFLVAAVIPMLGGEFAKSQKKPQEREHHGLIECFWVDNGSNLALYKQDTISNPDGVFELLGSGVTSCDITLPKANYYKIHAIGAGGNGGYASLSDAEIRQSNRITTSTTPGAEYSDSIVINSSFATELQKKHQVIKDTWNSLDLRANFTDIQSYAGRHGDSSDNQCTDGDKIVSCEYSAAGGKGNPYLKRDLIKVPIKTNTSVVFNDSPSSNNDYIVRVSTDGAVYSVKNYYSGTSNYYGNPNGMGCNGKDGTCHDASDASGCTDGTNCPSTSSDLNLTCTGSCDSNVKLGASTNLGYSNGDAILPKFVADNAPNFTFKYQFRDLQARYSTPGGNAEHPMIVYEKLDIDKLILSPAKTSADSTTVTVKKQGMSDHVILEALSGADGSGSTLETFNMKSTGIFEHSTTKKSLLDYIKSKTHINPLNYNYVSMYSDQERGKGANVGLVKRGLTPGAPGHGGHPVFSATEALTYVEVNDSYSKKTTNNANLKLANTALLSECQNGDGAVKTIDGTVCRPGFGHPGAVIVSW